MAERDKYERQVGRDWEDPLNLIRAQAPFDDVWGAVNPSLVKILKRKNVIPAIRISSRHRTGVYLDDD